MKQIKPASKLRYTLRIQPKNCVNQTWTYFINIYYLTPLLDPLLLQNFMVSLSNWQTYRFTPFCNGARGKPEGKNKCELDILNLKCKFIYSILPNLTSIAPYHTVNACDEYVCAHDAPSHPCLPRADTDPTLIKGLHDNYWLWITMRECIPR